MRPLVSVIVPVYNAGTYLPECIASLVAQTLENFEIILVNDASTDESLTILREYEGRYPGKVVAIDSPVHLGPGGSRNIGIRAARSEYVGFVDADDWVDVSMFAKMHQKAVDTSADVVHCFSSVADELSGERIVSQGSCPSNLTLSIEGKQLNDNDREILCLPGGATGGITQQLYRRSMLFANNLWFPEYITYEDMHFTKLVPFYVNRIAFVKEYLYFWRIHGNSIVNTRNAPWFMDKMRVQCMALDDIANRGLAGRLSAVVEYGFLFGYWWSTTRQWEEKCDGNFPTDTVGEMRKEIMRRFPRFRSNKYYKEYFDWRARILTNLMMLSPRSYTIANASFRLKDDVRRSLVEQLRKHPGSYDRLRRVYRRRPLG